MHDFVYKEYTEEESKVYRTALNEIMEGLKQGKNFSEACGAATVEDGQLKEFIVDDALKILIADLHYTKGASLQEVAETLNVSQDLVDNANTEMLQDIEISTTAYLRAAGSDECAGNA